MAYEKLICPNCSYQLTASPSQTQVACPRCDTWLELEARCNGVCLSCHALKKAESTGSCADLSAGVPVSIESSTGAKASSPEQLKNKGGAKGLKDLFKKVFNV
jgi:hypothetical protein